MIAASLYLALEVLTQDLQKAKLADAIKELQKELATLIDNLKEVDFSAFDGVESLIQGLIDKFEQFNQAIAETINNITAFDLSQIESNFNNIVGAIERFTDLPAIALSLDVASAQETLQQVQANYQELAQTLQKPIELAISSKFDLDRVKSNLSQILQTIENQYQELIKLLRSPIELKISSAIPDLRSLDLAIDVSGARDALQAIQTQYWDIAKELRSPIELNFNNQALTATFSEFPQLAIAAQLSVQELSTELIAINKVLAESARFVEAISENFEKLDRLGKDSLENLSNSIGDLAPKLKTITIDTASSEQELSALIFEVRKLRETLVALQENINQLNTSQLDTSVSVKNLKQLERSAKSIEASFNFLTVLSTTFILLNVAIKGTIFVITNLVKAFKLFVDLTKNANILDIYRGFVRIDAAIQTLIGSFQDGTLSFKELEKAARLLDSGLESLSGNLLKFNTGGVVKGVYYFKEALVTLTGVFDKSANKSLVFASTALKVANGVRAIKGEISIAQAVMQRLEDAFKRGAKAALSFTVKGLKVLIQYLEIGLVRALRIATRATGNLLSFFGLTPAKIVKKFADMNLSIIGFFERLDANRLLGKFGKQLSSNFFSYSEIAKTAFSTIKGVIDQTIGKFEEFNKVAVKAASSLVSLPDFGFSVSTPEVDLSQLQDTIRSQLASIEKESLSFGSFSTQSSQDIFNSLLPAFTAVKSEVSSVNDGIAKLGDLALSVSDTAGHLGFDFRQAGEEIQALLKGTADLDNNFSRVLDINQKSLNTWKKQGNVINEISKRLQSLKTVNLAGTTTKTVETSFKQLIDLQSSFTKEIGKLLQKPTVAVLDTLFNEFSAVSGEILKAVQKTLDIAFNLFDRFYAKFGEQFVQIYGVIKEFATVTVNSFITLFQTIAEGMTDTSNWLNPITAIIKTVGQGLLQLTLAFSKFAIFIQESPIGRLILQLTAMNLSAKLLSQSFGYLIKGLNQITGASALFGATVSAIKLALFISGIVGLSIALVKVNFNIKLAIVNLFNLQGAAAGTASTMGIVTGALKSFAWTAAKAFVIIPALASALLVVGGEIVSIFKSVSGASTKLAKEFDTAIEQVENKLSRLQNQDTITINVDTTELRLDEIKKSQGIITKSFEFIRKIIAGFINKIRDVFKGFIDSFAIFNKLPETLTDPLKKGIEAINNVIDSGPITKFLKPTFRTPNCHREKSASQAIRAAHTLRDRYNLNVPISLSANHHIRHLKERRSISSQFGLNSFFLGGGTSNDNK